MVENNRTEEDGMGEVGIMSKIKYFLVLLLAIVFIAGCTQVEIEEKKPIKIGIDVFPGWGHIFIAEEKGFFKKNGVDVEIVLNENYLDIQNQFMNNELDGVFMVYADAIYINEQGINNGVVYISDYSISGDVIIAKPELTGVKDLRGKTIGVEGINSFSHLFVLSVLEKHGLSDGDFFIKNVDAQEVVAAIERGDIDAGHTYGRGKIMAKEKGYVYLAFAGDVEGIITDTLTFHKRAIEMRPDDLKAIVKSLFEAKRFQETNRAEALEIIAKAIKETPQAVGIGVDAVGYIDLEENVCMMNLECLGDSKHNTSLYVSGKLIADFYLKRGQLSAIPDFNEIIEPVFVNELIRERQETK